MHESKPGAVPRTRNAGLASVAPRQLSEFGIGCLGADMHGRLEPRSPANQARPQDQVCAIQSRWKTKLALARTTCRTGPDRPLPQLEQHLPRSHRVAR